MHRTIAGARALVTGASGGLGRAIAIELARRGADLVLVARRSDKLAEVAAEISRLNLRAEIVVGDITDAATRTAALEAAKIKLGGLDILVNNAGVGALARFESSNLEQSREVFEVNYFAPIELIRESLPLLKNGRQPILVNITSILGHRAAPQNSDYCASKFALRGWSEAVRVELMRYGIDVLLASPGSTATEFWDNVVSAEKTPPWSVNQAMPANVTAHKIVRAIQSGKRELIVGWRNRWFVRLGPLALPLNFRYGRMFFPPRSPPKNNRWSFPSFETYWWKSIWPLAMLQG